MPLILKPWQHFFPLVATLLCCCTLAAGTGAASDSGPMQDQPMPHHLELVSRLEQQVLLPITQVTPGAAVVVVLDGLIVLEKAYGVRQLHQGAPITTRTLFRIASLSKTFASAAAAILVAQESISWDTPVTSSLANINFKRTDYGERINLYHLMSQSTGLMPHAYTNLIEDRMSYQRMIQRLDRVDFICAPGDCYGYQNVVFSLIGDVIQATTHTPYTAYVNEKLFRPLAMDRASFGLDSFINDEDHAEPHVQINGEWQRTRTTRNYYKVPPAAGINASISDMKTWMMAQLGHNPEVLPVTLLDQLQSGAIPTSPRQAHYQRRPGLDNIQYGLGWRVFDYRQNTGFIHHGGYVRGMRSEMLFNRNLQMGIVLLANSEPREMNTMIFDFLDLYQNYQASGAVASASQ